MSVIHVEAKPAAVPAGQDLLLVPTVSVKSKEATIDAVEDVIFGSVSAHHQTPKL